MYRKPVKRKLEEFDSTEHKVKKLGCSPREDSDSDSNCSLLIDEEKVPDENIDDQLERKAQETGLTATNVKNILHVWLTFLFQSLSGGARCSSVVRAFAHGAMGRQINPSWSGPIEFFLIPASAPRLV